MKITDLHVDGFGIWRDLSMNELSDRVTVVYGENEAGKTTLMHFVRTVLYGFSQERRDRYLPPVQGGTPGGRMTIALPHGRYRVRRFANGSEGPGDVEITSVDGSYQSCHQLATLLGGIDEPIFNNVFAVGLHEIQQLATLNDTQAAQHLYDLTTGLDRVSLFEVMRELAASRQRILSDDERPSQLVQLHAKRQQLEEELRLLHARTNEWIQLAGQVRASNKEIKELEERSTALERETRLVEIACNVHEPWQQRAEIEVRLASLGTLAEIPLEELESLEKITNQIGEYRTQVGEIKRRRKTLREEAAAVDLNEKLWRQRARVEALVEQRPWITSLGDQIARLEEEILDMDAELSTEQRQFGIKKGGALAAAIPQLSKENLAKLREPLREIREHKQRLTDAQREVEQYREQADEIQQQLDSELASRGVRSLSEAMERCGQQMSQARHQAKADDKVQKLFRQRDDMQQQIRLCMDRQVLPVRALVGLGVLFTVGSVLLLTAMLFKVFALTSATAGVLAVLGAGALLLTGAVKFGFEQVVGRQLDECRRQEELIQLQIDRVTGEDGSNAEYRRGDQDGPVQSAEREMAALEALVPLESDRERALQDADAAQRKVRQTEEAYQTARGRWRGNLKALGLPENLSPKEVKGFAGAWRVLGEKQLRINGRREELEQRQADLAAVSSRASHLLLEAGIQPKSPHLADRIDQLAEVLSRQQQLAERRDQLLKEARTFQREQQRHQTAGRKLMRQRREILRRLGVDGAQSTKDLPERLKEIRQRRETREELSSKIATSMGVVCAEEDLAGHVDGATHGQLEKRLESLLSQYDATADQLKKLYERRGQTTEQMNNLANDRRLVEVQLELSCVQQKIADAVRQWQALGVISLLLEEIRALYESDRQPETLREASGYLTQLTRGRYTRIWTPLGDNVLKVDDEASHALPVEYLSRGTREQVYLSLRMALVAAYARRGILLPLVLDDVLVNFDARRAAVAAKVLLEFAKAGHQILVFTCHEHIMEIFQSLNVEVRQLPANARGANVIAAPAVERPVVEPPAVVEEEYEEEDYEEEVIEEAEEEEEEIVAEEEEEELDLADDDVEEHVGEFEFSTEEMELPDDSEEEELVEVEVDEEPEEEEEPAAEPVLLEIDDEPEEEPAEEPEAEYENDETEWEEYDEGDDEEYEYIDDDEAARRLAWAEVSEWEEEEASGDEEIQAEDTDGAEAA